ncbi:EPIDERMAL PATTERNING FACTOR-like protein 4 [Raphanus sativus]|uniref:Epidermal patterning factor-like protein n=1 Tax=Raphanus sativus TaxID=3726 RepID=A0A6J0MB71_RAPSA|nr:EPIDERMAL PATTERNING FACTOR-like protein 4 [Raphanus sativus]KAJ4912278.1 EPIDERMAL PATTERNING FACTOR-like protein 4 [Raphanus sativus]
MGALRRRRRLFIFAALATFALLHVFLAVSKVSAVGWLGQRTESDFHGHFTGNKRFGGLGSSPPTCRSKCEKCQPCKPVHVPIQPGMSIPLEYYPEAWRCKCGDKLFMP